MNLNTIGESLRFYREKYDFKQSDVCNGICSISTLSRIENGNKQFYMYYKLQILENISMEEKCKMGIEALEYTNSINNHIMEET